VSVAVLSCRPTAAASHATAAHLHRLEERRPDVIEVAVPTGRQPRRDFIVHRSVDLVPHHVTRRTGIAVTTIERILVDGGSTAPLGRVGRWFDTALRLRLTTAEDVGRLLLDVAERGRNGVTVARQLVEERMGWTERTESELEDRFLRLVRRVGLPAPVAQWPVTDAHGRFLGRADFGWPDHGVAAELDGYASHSDPTSFRLDRVRQNRLVLAGITLLRFTWWDVDLRPATVVSDLGEALGFSVRYVDDGTHARTEEPAVGGPGEEAA